MNNKERIEVLVLDFVDHMGFDNPLAGSYKLWEEINKDTPTIDELLELGYVGLFITTLDALIALCQLKEDMVNVENVQIFDIRIADDGEALEPLSFRMEMLALRLRELLVKITKERLDK